jgi:predicted acetyltransferase
VQSSIEYRSPADASEMLAFARVLAECFPGAFMNERVEDWPKADDPAHVRIASVGGSVAGGLVTLPIGQWFGGRRVGMAGIRFVGVAPDRRAGGVATALMRAALYEAHAAGQPLSTLYPATQPVYRRVGYEQAGVNMQFRLDLQRIPLRDRDLRLRRVDPNAEAESLRRLYQTRAARTAGNLDRDGVRLLWDRVTRPRGASEALVFSVEDDAGPQGYIAYAFRNETPASRYDLLVTDFVALTAAAARRMVSHLADHHSQGANALLRIEPAAAALLCLDEQRARIHDHFAWMLRIVDVKGALEQRGYPPELQAELHLEVHDDVLPWNDGRFVLAVADGRGEVRAGGRGSLQIQARGLAPLYSGYLSALELEVSGLAAGDVEPAARLFSGARPWMSDWF